MLNLVPRLLPLAARFRSGSRGAISLLGAICLIGSVLATPARAGGLTPEEARARMKLPDGFQVQVFASEPEIRQPVGACFDERGRIWVIEYLQYPTPAGLKPVSVDQYLRTEYDHVPEPPPRGPRGADRIKILEDTDGDGRADKVTTFLEGLNLASALAVGRDGLFVGQAPYLLHYPDRDHDDRPDGDPEVLLTGFGLQDAHATVNSLAWGPDGWLYGAQGSTVTARIQGTEFQQGIWRYHPGTKAFELFAEGGGNTWGLDFDRAGNAFGSSNGGFVTFHMVQGGNYWKGFAKHGPLHNPRTFGYFDSVLYQGPKLGGHVTPGGIFYKADQFPEEYRGAFIGGNLLSNAVYWHRLTARGSTFESRHGGTLIDAQDGWFRPIDLFTGPDGSVYVVDWYDKRASHLDPRDTWDKSNGRIYKVSHGQPRAVPSFDLAKRASRELVDLRTQANDWWPDMARRVLAERRDASVVPLLKSYVLADRDEVLALRDLWALHVSGGLDDLTAQELLGHPVPGVRRWVARLLGDGQRINGDLRSRLVALAASEGDLTVRSQMASSCQRWRPDTALPILERLLSHAEDITDAHIPLQLWWALEIQMRGDPDGVVGLVARRDSLSMPLVREAVLERLARALAAGGTADDFARLARLAGAVAGPAEVERLVAGIDKGLEGQRSDRVPTPLEPWLRGELARSEPVPSLLRVAVRFGVEDAIVKVAGRISDPRRPEPERRAFIELLGQVRSPHAEPVLLALISKRDENTMAVAALNALANFDRAEIADSLLDRQATLPVATQSRVIDLLCGRKVWAEKLLQAIEDRRVPATQLRPSQVLQIAQLGDSSLVSRLEKAWGRVPGANSAEKRRRIAEVRGILPEGDKGDPQRGRPIFQQQCAVCHKLFNEGESIGPELTGSERGDLDFLLTSLVDPSSMIRKEYQAQTIALGDGRVLTGLVIEDSEKALTLIDSQRQKTVVLKSEIEEMRVAATSLMPEGMLDKLPDDQIRDLFRYLQSSGPTAN